MSKIQKNFFYSSILTTANYIFPLIVFPYITRVMGVSNVGLCDFVDSIINYFCLFSMLGIGTVGVREIASCGEDKEKMSKVFSSLLTLNMITTGIMTLILLFAILLVPKFNENAQLMMVGMFKLISKAFLVEWFYTGIEKFKYITTRSIIIRAVYVVAVLLFVRSQDDYVEYYALTTLIIIVNAIINIAYSRRFVIFSLKRILLKPYFKPVAVLGSYSLLTSMYTTFNISYLGFIGGNTQVGYYTTATRLHSIILALFTAFTGVMLPRMSSLLSEGNKEVFKSYVTHSIKILFAFAFPVVVFCVIYSDVIVEIIAGPGYEMAVPCMRMVLPLILVIGYEQILVVQILMPLKRDADILINSVIGASVGIITNILFVSQLLSIGSAIVWFLSEISVFTMAQLFVTRRTGIKIPKQLLVYYVLCYLPVAFILYFLHQRNQLGLFNFVLGVLFIVLCFFIIEIRILRNKIVVNVMKQMCFKMFSRKQI